MKIRRPVEDPPTWHTGRVLPYDKAREAAREKKLSQYIELDCGHKSTWEIDEIYSAWRPSAKKHFCELCGTWRVRAPKLKVANPPQEPLF